MNQIYYTTAQVTDMVELSDQNVRKYVRMLEERGYEVAKDEHQRRLFSQNDVHILNEMISVSKTPGFTLELAADEVMNRVDDIISQNTVEETKYTPTNDDVLKALEQVLEKLEDMRQENIFLRKNVSNLVARLEEYDTHILEVSKEQKLLSNQVDEIKDNTENVEKKEKQDSLNIEEDDNSKESHSSEETLKDEKIDSSTELDSEIEDVNDVRTEDQGSTSSSNIDMKDFEEPVKEAENSEEKKEKETSIPIQKEPKKKGFFARLFGN